MQTGEKFTFRPFSKETDYPAVTHVMTRVVPHFGVSEEYLRHSDATADPRCLQGRLVAAGDGGEIVGFVSYGQEPEMLHAGSYFVRVRVLPEYRRRGIGTTLYDAAIEALAPHDPAKLIASASEAETDAVAFGEHRGFVEVMRAWFSILDVPNVDLTRFDDPAPRLAEDGITIHSFADLAHDQDRNRKIWELDNAASADVPTPLPFTPFDYDWYVNAVIDGPMTLHDGTFIAVDRGRYVGVTALFQRGDGNLGTGFTGVLREYRRRGIAMALKLAAVRYAKARGVARIHTDNAASNEGMLSINGLLGFQRQPAMIDMVKTIRQNEQESADV